VIHDFDEKHRQGLAWERELDAYFRREFGYTITATTGEEQRRGVDRWFEKDNERFSVEYKGDERAATTGNGFVETGHLGPTYAKGGWVYTTEATWIAYYIVSNRTVYWMCPDALRKAIDHWIAVYGVKAAPNKNYWTYGVAVPLPVFEMFAELTLQIRKAA